MIRWKGDKSFVEVFNKFDVILMMIIIKLRQEVGCDVRSGDDDMCGYFSGETSTLLI